MKPRSARTSFSRVLVGLALVVGSVGPSVPPAWAAIPIQPEPTWQANARVNDIVRIGNTIYIGGEFTSVMSPGPGNTTRVRNRLAAIDATTGVVTSWDPNMNGKVFTLSASPDGTRLYVGGNFTKVGTVKRPRVAAFNVGTGALITSFAPPKPDNVVRAVIASDDTVYIGGAFLFVGTAERSKLAAFATSDGSLLPWAPTADGLVRTFALTSTRLYAGGNFQFVNGVQQKTLAALDPATGASITCPCHPGYPVLDLAATNRWLFGAGGGAGGRAVAYNINTGVRRWEFKSDGNVQAVGVQGSSAFFGGHFFNMNNVPVGFAVKMDQATGALDTSWLPDINGFLGVWAVSGFQNRLYLGGDFDHISGVHQEHFAQFTDPAMPNTSDLSIAITDTPDPVDVGGSLTYDVHVDNPGPDGATDVTVTDALPPSMTFVSASPGCTYNGPTHTVSCVVGSVAVGGAGADVSITVMAGAAGTIENTVSVVGNETDPQSANDQATASTEVTVVPGTADLSVAVIEMPEPALVGETLTYELTVSNAGPEIAPTVTVTDTLPADVTFVSATPDQGLCDGTSTVTCDVGPLTAGSSIGIDIVVTAPAVPMTVTNRAEVSGSFDPDTTDNSDTDMTTVGDGSADTTPPLMTSVEMFDDDMNGKIDRADVTFDEAIATCPAPCTAGWSLTGVPSNGTLSQVSTSGSIATLTIAEGPDDPDTAVNLFRIELSSPNAIQDPAGNHTSFGATAPQDKASPVPVALRKKNAVGGTNNRIDVGDELSTEWSEQLAPASIPSTTVITVTDPAGTGDDVLSITGFLSAGMLLGTDAFLTADDTTASWPSSVLDLVGVNDILTARVAGACQGTGCLSLGTAVGDQTVTYTASSTIEDPAGNPAVGSFTKTFKVF